MNNNNLSQKILIVGMCCFIGLLSPAVMAQTPSDQTTKIKEVWVNTYSEGEGLREGLVDMVVDSSGNVYGTAVVDNKVDDEEYSIFKYTSKGELEWSKKLKEALGDTSDNHYLMYKMVLDNSGNIYVTGAVYSSIEHWDVLTVKFNASGQLQWSKIYKTSSFVDEVGYDIVINNSSTNQSVYVLSQKAIIKYDSKTGSPEVGGIVIDGEYGYPYAHLALDKEGNIILGSMTYNKIDRSSHYDLYIAKFDASYGTKKWEQFYENPYWKNGSDFIRGIAVDSDNNVIVAGSVYGASQSTTTTLMKLSSSNGAFLWTKMVQGWDDEVLVDNADNIITNTEIGILSKYSPDGEQLWSMNQGEESTYMKLAIDGTGNIYALSIDYFGENMYTKKYNPNGEELWRKAYTGDMFSGSIALDPMGNVFVGAAADPLHNYTDDIITIRYTEIPAIVFDLKMRDKKVQVGGTLTYGAVLTNKSNQAVDLYLGGEIRKSDGSISWTIEPKQIHVGAQETVVEKMEFPIPSDALSGSYKVDNFITNNLDDFIWEKASMGVFVLPEPHQPDL